MSFYTVAGAVAGGVVGDWDAAEGGQPVAVGPVVAGGGAGAVADGGAVAVAVVAQAVGGLAGAGVPGEAVEGV